MTMEEKKKKEVVEVEEDLVFENVDLLDEVVMEQENWMEFGEEYVHEDFEQ